MECCNFCAYFGHFERREQIIWKCGSNGPSSQTLIFCLPFYSRQESTRKLIDETSLSMINLVGWFVTCKNFKFYTEPTKMGTWSWACMRPFGIGFSWELLACTLIYIHIVYKY